MADHAQPTTADPHHTPDDHGSDHGHADVGHGDAHHGGEALGPIDVPAWAAAGLGLLLGLVVVVALMAAAA